MSTSADVLAAVKLLEKSEQMDDAVRRTEDFTRAIRMLDNHLQDRPDSPDKGYIKNVRLSHARKLLQDLPSTIRQDGGLWLRYFSCFSLVSDEVSRLKEEDAELKKVYEDFWSAFGSIADLPVSEPDVNFCEDTLRGGKS